MTIKVEINSDRQQAVSLLDSDSMLILNEGVTISDKKTALVATGKATDREIDINGTLSSTAGSALVFGETSVSDSRSAIIVGTKGRISGGGDGVVVRSGGVDVINHGTIEAVKTALSIKGDHGTLVNDGLITSKEQAAISAAGNSVEIVNSGTIRSAGHGLDLAGTAGAFTNNGMIDTKSSAVFSSETGAIVTNHGTLIADRTTVLSMGNAATITNDGIIQSRQSTALEIQDDRTIATNNGTMKALKDVVVLAGDDITFTNNGLISTKAVGIAIEGDRTIVTNNKTISAGSGIHLNGADGILTNTGTIAGTAAGRAAIDLFGENGNLHNTGKILSSGIAVSGGSGTQSVFNTGTIKGSIDLKGGNDFFDGTGGRVIGTVSGGKGDDVYVVGDGKITLVETAGGGVDLVQSTKSFTLATQFENLILNGTDNVAASGNGLANQLHGNVGNNLLDGKSGMDMLWGHAGKDILTGGLGADQFVFATGDGKDTITDFSAKGLIHDTLDLTGFSSIFNYGNLVAQHMTQSGNDVLIDGQNGDSILLKHVLLSDLHQSDFLF